MAKNLPETKAEFIEPMECLPVDKVPDEGGWLYELKLDGYRLQAVKGARDVMLYSRRRNTLNDSFGYIAGELTYLPQNTVLDGELVALSEDGKPSFNLLQNFRSSQARITFFVFDILVHQGRELLKVPLSARRSLLRSVVRPGGSVDVSEATGLPLAEILRFVKSHGLEGIVAKRADSIYEPGLRTGLWRKQRINLGQEFVVGGFVPSDLGVDSLVVGIYRDNDLHYIARVRAGFVPTTRREVFERIRRLKTPTCPFVNLPQRDAGRWGQGLTAEKMKECVWVRPEMVAQVEFLEWTGADHLRHTRFIRLRDDKDPRKVVRET